MNKLLSLLTALAISFIASSQVEVGVFAGPQTTSVRYLVYNQKQSNEYKYGFQAGVNLKVPFEGKLSFAPALFYSMKGYKVVFKDFVYPPDSTAKDNNTTIHTVEIAPLLQYDLGKNPGHAFIRVGPSLDLHLSGKENFTRMDGTTVDRSMKFSFSRDYGHFSANLLFHLGYETGSGFFFFGQYTHGLASTSNADGGPRIYHRAYGISFGKYFNRKKIVIDTRNRE